MKWIQCAASTGARALLWPVVAGDSSYQIAQAYSLRRDPDNLFKWLD
ncbi:MAG TPA: hypothetical protein VK753_08795 [Xanthomonadaceae bacterium]|nr:hypothetical protein [Xanthomonadaceae bacterium]